MGDNLPAVNLGTGRTAQALAMTVASTCAVLDNGAVKCWGSNFYGELGLGDTKDRGYQSGQMGDDLPAVDLGAGRTAHAIAAHSGGASFCALLDNDTLKCWGENVFGELGLGDAIPRGSLPNQMGDNLPALNLGSGRTVRAVAAGVAANCALLDNGTVKCWGIDNYGQLGLGDAINRGGLPGQMGDNLPALDLTF